MGREFISGRCGHPRRDRRNENQVQKEKAGCHVEEHENESSQIVKRNRSGTLFRARPKTFFVPTICVFLSVSAFSALFLERVEKNLLRDQLLFAMFSA
jgi:hypothetical protein